MSTTATPQAADAEETGRVDHRRPAAVHPELAGTTAVVTGAARGMGAVFSEGLALRGVNVIAADIDLDAMKGTAEAINAQRDALPEGGPRGRVVPAAVDVVDPAGHEELARLAHSAFGRLDHWVNNAGVFPHAFVQDISPEQIDAVLKVNVQGVLFGSQAAARHMRPGGSIVNMSSVSAVRVRKGRGAYCASKASVAHLTESLAVELGDQGLRVNAIAPGYIDTEMTRWVREDPAALRHALDSVPLHRLGSPQEVLGVLLFLLSDSARYVTGHSIAVDGGSRHV
ncbi:MULTISPECIES: SDR family NAD(P)-dependent oxidoreductase [Streptomyces]|uniref:3-oxoacyl-[acyl-carrier protein] reductase n=2 Tax=Streptomyces TaxID=1883 RepID=A0ABT9L524_9ACTN|nr:MULTISPECIES: glucose 1-dehydrogenase [Streptomyces]MBW8090933.1 glucose 1-dehydrogenase [Streptomyces hygroscopicus subsp. hygroscopicus]MDP9615812.1 3-oxoacyl-[acyl-carrier protein] reductase [Streptomyces demainii]GHJ33709.1 short-chain dehydrogenase [Streptomyces hygroscopicus]